MKVAAKPGIPRGKGLSQVASCIRTQRQTNLRQTQNKEKKGRKKGPIKLYEK